MNKSISFPGFIEKNATQSFYSSLGLSDGNNGCELYTAAIESIEQGVWTVISYFSEMDLKASLKVAKIMQCSINHIHEFDWERIEDTFGSKCKFLKQYSNVYIAHKAMATASALVGVFKFSIDTEKNNPLVSSHACRIYSIGIVVGSAAALGEVYKLDPNAANEISKIVSAPIALDTESLLTEIATF